MKRRVIYSILVVILTLSMTTASLAQSGIQPAPGTLTPDSTYSANIDKGGQPAVRSLAGVQPGNFQPVSIIVTTDGTVDASALEAVSGGKVIHRYEKVFKGFSLITTGGKIADVAAMKGVTKVYLDEVLKTETEVSPQFIGAPTVWAALGGQESAGEGVTVGVLDTGIWPEHPSFSDPDPSGKAYSPPAVVPGSNGFGSGGARSTCDFGNTGYNPNDAPFTCNNKLIGAYEFLDTYKALAGLLPAEFDSARDADGHGTHTSSTAAGNAGVNASIFGVPRGVISGIAPRAHVIMYRVCGADGCYSSDSAAAVEQAILDQVNAINFSISGGANPFSDAVSLAFLAAYENGVFVAASAGNSGPGADTTDHREPWVTTVAASTGPRSFTTTAHIAGSGGATLDLTGTSLTAGVGPAPVFVPTGSLSDIECDNPLTAGSVTGMIVVCARGTTGRAQKGWNVLQGGAAGMIQYNQSAAVTDLETDNHFLPAIQIQYSEGQDLLAFLAANPGATATWAAGVAGAGQADVMASFSSRGGPGQSLGVSKPDITAPGVQILAGQTPMPLQPPDDYALGPTGQYFQAIAGTSMSSPHIAGSGALLAALHPDWTPGQIKSALMTTAFAGVVKEDGVTPADSFDYGSGRVDLNEAGDPGLTFDDTAADYVALGDELWNANYPSLYIPVMPGIFSVQRTVHSVADQNMNWTVSVESPKNVKIKLPSKFTLKPGEDYTFTIAIEASKVPLGEVQHATIFFTSKNTVLRFPVTFVRRQPVVALDKTCDPGELSLGGTTNCTITVQNNSFDSATVSLFDYFPASFDLVPGSVVGATSLGTRGLTFSGSLFGAAPPLVQASVVDPGTLPGGGYLPLSLFGIAPISGVGDETITNFNVPAFPFAGQSYTRIGMVSDGYAVVGGGTGADVEFVNQSLPDPTPPNNVLAPFWSDLNPAFGGAMRAGVLTDGADRWLILDWEGVVNYGGGANSFQIWIGLAGDAHPGEDITFAFGTVTGGEAGFLTVGAENSFGNSGQNIYYNGTGTAPSDAIGVRVESVPSTPGESHVITFSMVAIRQGQWANCANLTSNLFQGTNVACFFGNVLKTK
jgi:hypothetical protein